jgi:hypothetical protein
MLPPLILNAEQAELIVATLAPIIRDFLARAAARAA